MERVAAVPALLPMMARVLAVRNELKVVDVHALDVLAAVMNVLAFGPWPVVRFQTTRCT
jgi:hypothetical protein